MLMGDLNKMTLPPPPPPQRNEMSIGQIFKFREKTKMCPLIFDKEETN